MSEIRTVIFDFYGTLADVQTNEKKDEIFKYLSMYLRYYGADIDPESLKISLDREKERFVKTKHERHPEIDFEIIFKNILREESLLNPFLPESCIKLFRLLSMERLQLFPDTLSVLKEIRRRRYAMGIISDAQKVFFYEEINKLGLTPFFDHIILSTAFGFRKPDDRLFTIACTLMETEPDKAVYIGDNVKRDIEGAKNIGMYVILINRENANMESEIKPDYYANNLTEAWEWIRNFS